MGVVSSIMSAMDLLISALLGNLVIDIALRFQPQRVVIVGAAQMGVARPEHQRARLNRCLITILESIGRPHKHHGAAHFDLKKCRLLGGESSFEF